MNNKEAIAILTHNWKYRELIDNGYQYEALDLAIKALEERPTGHWIDNGLYAEGRNEHLYICSVCGHRIFADKYILPQFKGCYCGADMRGKENEQTDRC